MVKINNMKIIVISSNNYLKDVLTRYINFALIELVSEEKYLSKIIEADLIIGDEINFIPLSNQPSIILTNQEIKAIQENLHYLTKPIKINNLFELINNFYKKLTKLNEDIIIIGGNKLNLSNKTFYQKDESKITFTQKEIDLISFLYRNQNKKFKKFEILEQVWGYSSKATSHTLETHLYRLRQKLNNIDSLILNDEDGRYFINPLLIK